MQKVEHVAENRTVFEPLIPKSIWWVIGVFYSFICFLPIVLGMQESTLLFLDQLNVVGFEISSMRQSAQLISQLVFVFAALTLSDMLLKVRSNKSLSSN